MNNTSKFKFSGKLTISLFDELQKTQWYFGTICKAIEVLAYLEERDMMFALIEKAIKISDELELTIDDFIGEISSQREEFQQENSSDQNVIVI